MTNPTTTQERATAFLAHMGFDPNGPVITHYGVPGMKWGVRNDEAVNNSEKRLAKAESDPKSSRQERKALKKAVKADKKWDKQVAKKAYFEIYNKAADRMNSEIDALNERAEFKDADFTDASPLRTKYYKAYSDAMTKHLNDAAAEYGENPSGDRRLKFAYDVESMDMPDWWVEQDD